jgi:hypothetical protein
MKMILKKFLIRQTMEEQTLTHFIKYNNLFFEGRLDNIKLEWSDRMNVSAAIFYPDKKLPKKLGKICFNRKLLKERSDKELLETLLVSLKFLSLNTRNNLMIYSTK